jgi:beta-alanine degradation protein BauB
MKTLCLTKTTLIKNLNRYDKSNLSCLSYNKATNINRITAMNNQRPSATGKPQIENDRVIVTQWCFPPGGETGWHKHGYDYVVIPELDGQLKIETKDGESISELKAGQSYYRPAGIEHNVINANDFYFAFVEVELK